MSLALNFERKCRTCGTDILELTCGIPIFGSGLQLDYKIQRYLGLNISLHDDLPKCLCATCFIKVESIDKFAVLAKKTEEAYLGWFKCIRANLAKHYSPIPAGHQLSVGTKPVNVPQKVDFSVLKQVVNDQISTNQKNPSIKPENSVISYSDLKLGLLIKDQELLKLILKALKWAEHDQRASFEVLVQRLKNTTFRDILSNRNLLNDSDLIQLLKSHIGQESFNSSNNAINMGTRGVTIQPVVQSPSHSKISTICLDSADTSSSTVTAHSGSADFRLDEDSVTQMEVGVDPSLFLDDEESQTKSRFDFPRQQENMVTIKLVPATLAHKASNEKMIPAILKCDVRNNGLYVCTNCPETFTTNTDLQQHIVTSHLLNPVNIMPEDLSGKKVIKIRVKKPRTKDQPTIPKLPVQLIPPTIPDCIPPKTTITVIPAISHPVQTKVQDTTVDLVKPKSTTTKPKTKRKREVKRPIKMRLALPKRSRSRVDATKGSSKLTCTICKKRVSTKGNLKVHMNSHKPKGKHTCEKCDRVFKTAMNLSRHKQYHAGETFSCDRCRRVYPTSSTLKAHKITHSDARPHKCTICDKTFKRNQDLKFHLNQHTGARPYQCPHCPKSFASSGNCFSHRKRMHTNEVSTSEETDQKTGRKP